MFFQSDTSQLDTQRGNVVIDTEPTSLSSYLTAFIFIINKSYKNNNLTTTTTTTIAITTTTTAITKQQQLQQGPKKTRSLY